jgi:hypothetical protein
MSILGFKELCLQPGVHDGFEPEGEFIGGHGGELQVPILAPALGQRYQAAARSNADLAAAIRPSCDLDLDGNSG